MSGFKRPSRSSTTPGRVCHRIVMPARRANAQQAVYRPVVPNGRPGGLTPQAIQKLALGQATPALREPERTIRALTPVQEDAGQSQKMDLLERRLQKLTHLLDRQERELQLVQQRVVGGDSGVSSEYRKVQGLAPGDEQFEQKKDLISARFDANRDLHNQIDAEAKAS